MKNVLNFATVTGKACSDQNTVWNGAEKKFMAILQKSPDDTDLYDTGMSNVDNNTA